MKTAIGLLLMLMFIPAYCTITFVDAYSYNGYMSHNYYVIPAIVFVIGAVLAITGRSRKDKMLIASGLLGMIMILSGWYAMWWYGNVALSIIFILGIMFMVIGIMGRRTK